MNVCVCEEDISTNTNRDHHQHQWKKKKIMDWLWKHYTHTHTWLSSSPYGMTIKCIEKNEWEKKQSYFFFKDLNVCKRKWIDNWYTYTEKTWTQHTHTHEWLAVYKSWIKCEWNGGSQSQKPKKKTKPKKNLARKERNHQHIIYVFI